MAAKPEKFCGLAGCRIKLGPGAMRVTFTRLGKDTAVDVCAFHGDLITRAPRGTWHITENFELKPIPAKPTIIT